VLKNNSHGNPSCINEIYALSKFYHFHLKLGA
jgi:hypothetical protein